MMTPDLSMLHEQKRVLQHPFSPAPPHPLEIEATAGSTPRQEAGRRLIAEGKMGVILLAGGQGTRLRFAGPKGLYPIGKFSKKTVFQRFYERVKGAEAQARRELPVAIMTSPDNDTLTRTYFEQWNTSFSFFTQKTLPLLDEKGELFLNASGTLSQGPDGNGECLKQFVLSGLCAAWKKKGVEAVQVILVDNLLANPFDSEMVGCLLEQQADCIVQCTERAHATEKMGVLVQEKGTISVREYSEMAPEEMAATLPNGKLKYHLANLSTFCFSLSFIEKSVSFSLPLHPAHKAAPSLLDPQPKKPNAWKFERFLFDLLPFAKKVVPLFSPRNRCYAPLKNSEGENSPEEVQRHVQDFDRMIFQEITQLPSPSHPFELSPLFYYPTDELLKKWKGKAFPDQLNILEP